MLKYPANCITGLILTAALVLLPTSQSRAGTVLQVGTNDLLSESALVIHGHVTERWTEYDQRSDTIYTNFRIDIEDIIKGKYLDDTIVVKFVGGTHAGRALSISDMHMPTVGEEGIYFVERPGVIQVHPFYGWQQGHFVVRHSTDGMEKVIHTADLRPVFAVDPAQRTPVHYISTGVATGIDTQELESREPMTIAAFKTRLRQLAEVQ